MSDLPKKKVTAGLIIIGNEILSGRTVDANLAVIARFLGDQGIQMVETRIVLDVESAIAQAIQDLKGKVTYLFTTGGIGPTHDDITSAAVAFALDLSLVMHPEAEQLLRNHYPPEKLTDARLKMAQMPDGAELIRNPVSAAPGFKIENIFVLAGVPKIMHSMLEDIKPHLVGGEVIHSVSLTVFASEGDIAAQLTALQDEYNETEIGSYPFFNQGKVGTSIVFRSARKDDLEKALSALEVYCRQSSISVSKS